MTAQPGSAKKTPWLIIILGVLAVLCLCAVLIVIAIVVYLTPLQASTATQPPPIEIFETEPALPGVVPTQENAESGVVDAAPPGTAVDIGNDMTLTVQDVTRPANDIVANGSVLNTTAPDGEEFIQVDVEVTCKGDPGTQCTFYPTVMKALLSDGSRRDLQTFIEGVEDWDTSIEIDGGATEQGFLLFIVPKSELNLVVSYADASADQPVHLQLP